MTKKTKNIVSVSILLMTLIALITIGLQFSKKAVFIEYTTLNDEKGTDVGGISGPIIQTFQMPYNRFEGVEICFGIYGRDNNSDIIVQLQETSSGRTLYTWNVNANAFLDEEYYAFTTGNPIRTHKGEQYQISLGSNNATPSSCVTSFKSNADKYSKGDLTVNGQAAEGDLMMRIRGGDADRFSFIFFVILAIIFLAAVSYALFLFSKGKRLTENRLLVGVGLFFGFFILLYIGIYNSVYIDEVDYVLGGMNISQGGQLYQTFYTQHMPFTYYLNAVFALMGAHSVYQFRLLFYTVLSLLWVWMFFRYNKQYGRWAMLLYPIAYVVMMSALDGRSFTILADQFHAQGFVILFLEFLSFCKDREMNWKRSIVIGFSIVLSLGNAFVSTFGLLAIAIGVIGIEITDAVKEDRISGIIPFLIRKYWMMLACCILPFVLLTGFYYITGNIGNFYRQAYRFNREIYSYYSQYGESILGTIFTGVREFIGMFTENILKIDKQPVPAMIFLFLLFINLLFLFRKKKEFGLFPMLILVFFLCESITRGYGDFHSLPYLAVTVMMGMLWAVNVNWKNRSAKQGILTLLLLFLIYPFVGQIHNFIEAKPEKINTSEYYIEQFTEPGDYVFSGYSVPTAHVYLQYKGRIPAVRNQFILPWYMDWFESTVIEDLEETNPLVIEYYPDRAVWAFSGFSPALTEYIEEHYKQYQDENVTLWFRNDYYDKAIAKLTNQL